MHLNNVYNLTLKIRRVAPTENLKLLANFVSPISHMNGCQFKISVVSLCNWVSYLCAFFYLWLNSYLCCHVFIGEGCASSPGGGGLVLKYQIPLFHTPCVFQCNFCSVYFKIKFLDFVCNWVHIFYCPYRLANPMTAKGYPFFWNV